jgi:ABC-type Fe3+-hydroxamate transport system substrate-binding protein
MGKFKVIIFALLVGTLLSGCGGQGSISKNSFDASSDIAEIQDAVKVFEDLSGSAHTDESVENMARVASLNPAALDGIEASTNRLLNHINENWDSIGSGDSPDGISREVLKEWGEAYLFWVTYQRKIQTIGEGCLVNLETFSSCRNQKLSQTIELERQSTEPLNAVQAKIQAWKEKYVNQ